MLWKRENGTFETAWRVLLVPTCLEGVTSASLGPGLRLEAGTSSAEQTRKGQVINDLPGL